MPGLRFDVKPWTGIIMYLVAALILFGLLLTLSVAGAIIWIVLAVLVGAILLFGGQRVLGRAGGRR